MRVPPGRHSSRGLAWSFQACRGCRPDRSDPGPRFAAAPCRTPGTPSLFGLWSMPLRSVSKGSLRSIPAVTACLCQAWSVGNQSGRARRTGSARGPGCGHACRNRRGWRRRVRCWPWRSNVQIAVAASAWPRRAGPRTGGHRFRLCQYAILPTPCTPVGSAHRSREPSYRGTLA